MGARGLETASQIFSEREDDDTSAVHHVGAKLLLHEPVDVVVRAWDADAGSLVDQYVRTTVGRVLFNRILPEPMRFANLAMKRVDLKRLVDRCYRDLGPVETAHLVDGIKSIGFTFATRGGMTIGLWDIVVPESKQAQMIEADAAVAAIDKQFQRGLITEDERYEQVVELWQRVTKSVSDQMMASLGEENPIRMMTDSGARGNKGNIGQLGAMRGLMADPSGRIIDVPVRSNFREGMTVLEYFISTHGARKGLADTALRTADSGYLTRRLVDVAQDVITREDDCGTEDGSWIIRAESADEPEAFQRRAQHHDDRGAREGHRRGRHRRGPGPLAARV
jgi:DNA-directed RNA polymerase subunit beta'